MPFTPEQAEAFSDAEAQGASYPLTDHRLWHAAATQSQVWKKPRATFPNAGLHYQKSYQPTRS